MRPFWHPLSTLLLADPPCWVTAGALRLVLRRGTARVTYAGDRMWPALRHGASVDLTPPGEDPPRRGEVLLVLGDGIPDLLRVTGSDGDETWVAGDAEPGAPRAVRREAILGRTRLPPRRVAEPARRLARLALDLREALREGPDPAVDPAATVQEKYEVQGPFYAAASVPVDPALVELVERDREGRRRVLVVGSGVGSEAFALARRGHEVTGIDFAPAMVALARRDAARAGLEVRFEEGDLRRHACPTGSLDVVLFTYDVYSFLPSAAERVTALRRIREWLTPDGALLMSARRTVRPWQRVILTLQWIARRGRGAEWGTSHTRWIAPDGSLRRSFVKLFTERQLAREAERGGFVAGTWSGGHAEWRPLRLL